MALLRQCLMELRAAQALAQSRESRRVRSGPAAFERSPSPGEAMPSGPQRLSAGATAAVRSPSTYSH